MDSEETFNFYDLLLKMISRFFLFLLIMIRLGKTGCENPRQLQNIDFSFSGAGKQSFFLFINLSEFHSDQEILSIYAFKSLILLVDSSLLLKKCLAKLKVRDDSS